MSWKDGGDWHRDGDWWGNDNDHWDRKGGGWSGGHWGSGAVWKTPQGDKYGNTTTLGLKHPLAMEDRRELVLGLLTMLQEEVTEAAAASAPGSIAGSFRITVATWGPVLIHAVLFYLCRATPSMPIRTLFNEEKKFVIADAVRMLWMEHCSLYPSVEEKAAALQLLSECRFGDSERLLAQAKQAGFDPGEVEVKAAAGSSAPGALQPLAGGVPKTGPRMAPGASQASCGRALQRMGTDEELAHLRKRNEVLQLRKSLAEQEAKLLSPPEASGPSDVRSPERPDVSPSHEVAMCEVLPKGILQPVQLRGLQGSSASGTLSRVAASGSSASGTLKVPLGTATPKVGMQALAQGAWSANMALLDGKKPSDSPEQTALQSTQQATPSAAKAAAELANASAALIQRPPALTPLEATITALRTMRLQVAQEEAALEQEEARQTSTKQESQMPPSPSATGTDAKCSSTSGATSSDLREEIAQLQAEKAKLQEESVAKNIEKQKKKEGIGRC